MTNLKPTKLQQKKENLPKAPRVTFESIFFSEDAHFSNILLIYSNCLYFLIFMFIFDNIKKYKTKKKK